MMRALYSLYGPSYSNTLVYMMQQRHYRPLAWLKWYWSTQNFSRIIPAERPKFTLQARAAVWFLRLGMAVQLVAGLCLVAEGLQSGSSGSVPFGLALLVSYPLVWAHLLALVVVLQRTAAAVSRPKRTGKRIVCSVLASQVNRLRRRHSFTIVAVAGSVGKTSTKLAIAATFAASQRVIHQSGNYNVDVTVPLVVFNQTLPHLFNIYAWLRIFLRNEKMIKGSYPYDVVVLELGTDGPGQMQAFSYLQPDITVITALTPEHMEFFGTLDAVAAEELAVCDFSKRVLVNIDDTPPQYLAGKQVTTYGLHDRADYYTKGYKFKGLQPHKLALHLPAGQPLSVEAAALGRQGVKIVLAATACAHMLGVNRRDIAKGLQAVQPFAGRMQLLPGVLDSTLIDDTYNASPVAVEAALDVLYSCVAPQRIAILGTMNELGDYSTEAHREVGSYCRRDKLDWVVTIGSDAKKYLAPAAGDMGCRVESFLNPHAAGTFVREKLQQGGIVLAEGSQNRVFAEEALKPLLADPADASKLVRQSAYWLKLKRKQFR